MVAVLGASATSLGWVEGVAQGVVALLSAWVGWRSDRFRRRVPYVRWGYGLPVLGKGLLVAAVAWPMVLLGRTVDCVGKGIRSSPRDALVADTTPAADRGVCSACTARWTAPARWSACWARRRCCGGCRDRRSRARPRRRSITAAAFRTIFAIAAGLGLAALACTLLLREPPHDAALAAPPPTTLRDGLRGLSRGYWIVMAFLLLFSLANSSDTFLLLRASQVGLAPWEVVLIYALYSLVYTVAAYPIGLLSDRIGRWPLLGLGWAIYAVVYLALAVTGATAIWPLLAVYGVYIALTDGVGKALLADHVPRARRGLALGLFYMLSGGTMVAASVVAGLLWDRVGPAAPFWFGGATAAATVALLLIALAVARHVDDCRVARPLP